MNKLKYFFVAAFALPVFVLGVISAVNYFTNEQGIKDTNTNVDGNDYLDPDKNGGVARDPKDRDEDEPGSNNGDKKSANVIVSDAAQYGDTIEVRAFVSNHIEDGKCTASFRKGSKSKTFETNAYADASTSVCLGLEIDKSEFGELGTWALVVSYESTDATGQSKQTNVTIR